MYYCLVRKPFGKSIFLWGKKKLQFLCLITNLPSSPSIGSPHEQLNDFLGIILRPNDSRDFRKYLYKNDLVHKYLVRDLCRNRFVTEIYAKYVMIVLKLHFLFWLYSLISRI